MRWVIAGLLIAGCPSNDGPCVEVDLNCAPLYEPTFSNLFSRRIESTCGAASTGGSCHSIEGAQNGLVMETEDLAYDALLGGISSPRVIPEDPSCSLLIQRLASGRPSYQMPPAAPLSAAEQCAFVLWVADGTPRN